MSLVRPLERTMPARPTLQGRSLLLVAPAGPLSPAIAREAARRGARTALATPAGGGEGPILDCAQLLYDPGGEAEIDRLYEAALEMLARVDVVLLVVESRPLPPLHELTLEHWRGSVTEPLRQAFRVVQRAVDEFLSTGAGGRIVLTCQTEDDADGGAANQVVVEALRSFARCVAREYGRRGVVCNVVHARGGARPGGLASDLADRPLVEWALFLASESASFVNGEGLEVAYPAEAISRGGEGR